MNNYIDIHTNADNNRKKPYLFTWILYNEEKQIDYAISETDNLQDRITIQSLFNNRKLQILNIKHKNLAVSKTAIQLLKDHKTIIKLIPTWKNK